MDESTTRDTVSITFSPQSEKICRGGSGSCVVSDAENGVETESRKLPSSRYKGVVPQPNGRWGAQIYEKHQRVWLGTFNTEDEAARAYDTAAQRFRGRDTVMNLKKEGDEMEAAFLNSHSKYEIVDMLRRHTYGDEIDQSRRKFAAGRMTAAGGFIFSHCRRDVSAEFRDHLFEKAVTPSDVGKLNRLVIPKQHAEKHFPLQNTNTNNYYNNNLKGILLNFEDSGGKVWRFRYSYWNSSHSYVLTKGWSRFVKEKGLRAGDIVSFQQTIGPEKQLYIDWKPKGLGPARTGKTVRLFGVDISAAGATNINWRRNMKTIDMEFMGIDSGKRKQRLVL